MFPSPAATSDEHTLYAALELSKNSWLLAIQSPGRDNPSLHPIKGGDADGLIAKLDAARERLAKASGQVPKVTLCYEALARVQANGLVVSPDGFVVLAIV